MPKKFPTVSKGFNPFCDLIGLTFTKFQNGYTQCTLNLTKGLLNPHKTAHGAVLYAMADTGMGGALYTLLEEEELCATIEIKITYFKAVKSGTLVCDTNVINKGKKVAALESEIKLDDQLIAKATGTFSIFEIK